jgi:CBS domain-containing protein
MEELFEKATNQNFVPVVDDNNVFIGIITRKDIILYLANKDNAN